MRQFAEKGAFRGGLSNQQNKTMAEQDTIAIIKKCLGTNTNLCRSSLVTGGREGTAACLGYTCKCNVGSMGALWYLSMCLNFLLASMLCEGVLDPEMPPRYPKSWREDGGSRLRPAACAQRAPEAEIQDFCRILGAPARWEMGAAVGQVLLCSTAEMHNSPKFLPFLPCCL